MNKRRGGVLRLVLFGVLLAVTVFLVLQRQYIVDQLAVWSYKPSSEIEMITRDAYLSEGGKFYLYASHAEVDDADKFNSVCQRQEEQSAILGCYANQKIYIYNVVDTRLKGIREVTAAHEMLHAVWDRLDQKEHDRLMTLLEAELKKHDSKELQDRMAYYERTEAGDRVNELHSIVGTEFADISSELEEHYRRYFTDRQALVRTYEAYNQVFKNLEEKSNALLKEVESLKKSVDDQLARYNSARAALEVEDREMQSLYNSLDRSDASAVAAYNARVQSFNADVAALREQYESVNTLINRYNAKVKAYNETVVSRQNLQDSIDSSKTPQPIN